MRQAVRKSLEYYTAQFGPYPHHQARIIEFPRTVDLAQAFPGTMPYSESIGFIANLEHPDDIDHVTYVVAHEMAHQWWAHQIVGADVQGARLLSESLAQYSALMVMEKQYGRDMMRKFLAYELDNYLRGRAAYSKREMPLAHSESDQGFVFYNKASLVMYCLRERIGADAVNRALRRMLARYRYAPPPYPTSFALTDALRAETPKDLQYLIRDLFEKVTIFNNRTLSATATRLPNGKYDVQFQYIVSKSQLDASGHEFLAPLDDVIDIGVLSSSGKLLATQTLRIITSNPSEQFLTARLTTDELPSQAGVDPLSLLIDKSPGENLRKVEISSAR
jgi:aminopeptidase N